MDVAEGSEWFLISVEWLNKWKEYTKYDTNDSTTDASMDTPHPGMITNEDIIEQLDNILIDRRRPHLNVNLKENLREEDHYHLVNKKLWEYLYIRYGGVEMKRFGVKREDTSDECIIEANLIKIQVHYFPSQKEDEENHVNTIYESRFTTLESFKERLADLKDKKPDQIKLWKAPIPSDFEAFYRNNLCEFKKHRQIRINAELLKKLSVKLSDVQFTMDDFLIVECRCPGGFIFEEIEKPEDDHHLNDNMELEEAKEHLSDPSTLKFLNLDITTILKQNSNAGLSGLSNLGNTCFMNSALQCMSNTIELTKYFLFGLYKDEINYDNPLGTKGRLAAGYAKLMKELWVSSDSRVAPWDVKKAIGTVAYQFQGFAQQDSFELFNYVADTLHEDLNRVKEKPYTEVKDSNGRPDDEVSRDHWEAFTGRNRSVIVDLMYGQLKSRLICTVCNNVSNTFDPFLALSLPIPKSKMTKLTVIYFPLSISKTKTVQRLSINAGYTDTVEDVITKISEIVGCKNKMLLYTLKRKNAIDERLDKDVKATKLEDEKLAAYEYIPDEDPKSCAIIPVVFTKESRSVFGSSNHDDVCEPKVFVFNIHKTCSDLRRIIFDYMFSLIKLPEQYQETYDKMENKEKAINSIYENFYLKSDHGSKKVFTFEYEKEKSMYASQRKYAPFEDSDKEFAEFLDSIKGDDDFTLRVHFPKDTRVDLSPLESGAHTKSPSGTISIDDCLEKFRMEELLKDDNQYYCGKCKQHQDTYKKMDIYKLPKILVIQLKRFNKGGGSSKYSSGIGRMVMGSSKNSDLIDFPIEGLDMGKFLLDQPDGQEAIYDLYAVSNHMGSLYGGHYTAHCKNSITNKWYYFNDSS